MIAGQWKLVRASLARPYAASPAMLVLMALVPAYIFVAGGAQESAMHRPAIALDAAIPLVPGWAVIYGTAYLWLILLPVFLVRSRPQVDFMFLAWLFAWITAYAVFYLWPTAAPRPAAVPTGPGFGIWGLRSLYAMDVPRNCFPSLHVAHSFISAFACRQVDRRVGVAALVAATVVAASTLFTKQHYVVDVVAGIALAAIAWALFLRRIEAASLPDVDRRAAPALAVAVGGISLAILAGYVCLWLLGVNF